MARPIKKGLDYFPVDFNLFNDRKFRKAKQKFGYISVNIFLSLLKIAYRDEGYFIDYADNKKEDIIWEIQEDLTGKYQPTAELIEQVIESLVASELFSVDHFKNKIITSKRIQITYYTAKKKSESLTINHNIWMLSIEEMIRLGRNNSILKNIISKIKGISSEIIPVNSEITTQSKEKNNKEKNSKEDESNTATPQNILNLYNEKCPNLIECVKLSNNALSSIDDLKYIFDLKEITKVFEKANASEFLQGNNDSGFKATFDWIIKPDNAFKIINGMYDIKFNKKNAQVINDKQIYSKEELDNIFNKDDMSNFEF